MRKTVALFSLILGLSIIRTASAQVPVAPTVQDSATDPTGVACTSAAPILRYTSGGTSTMFACTGSGGTVYAAMAGGGGGPFLPLTGGTLTGALNGTDGNFSGTVAAGASVSAPQHCIGASCISAWPTSSAVPSAYPAINPTTVIVYGDSNSAYASGTTCYYQGTSTCWVNRVGTYLGATVTNYAVSGDQACDAASHAFNYDSPGSGAQPFRALMIGTNDANTKGIGNYEATFNKCDQALLSWLTVPSSLKTLASTGTTTGTCTTDTTYAAAYGEKCTAIGSTITQNVTTYGGPIYIWPRYIDSDTGTWTYSIDGGAAVPVTTALPTAIATINGLSTAPGLIRVPVASGSHSIVYTQTNAGTMAVVGSGTPAQSGLTAGLPYLFDMTIFNQLDGNYARNFPGSSVIEYRLDIASNFTLLRNDSLQIYYVPVDKFVPMTTAVGDAYNTLHINVLGGAEVAQSIFSAMTAVPSTIAQQASLVNQTAVLSAEKTSSSDTFTYSSDWTGSYATGFTHAASEASSIIDTSVTITVSLLYQVTTTITGYSAGTLTAIIGGVSSPIYLANGTYNFSPQASGTGKLTFTPSASFVGTVTFSLKQISANSVPPYYALNDTVGGTIFSIQPSTASLQNTWMGTGAGGSNTTGYANTAAGNSSLYWNTTGYTNTAVGMNSLSFNTTGNSNTAIGYQALAANISGGYNTASGAISLYSNTTGTDNTANGVASLYSNTTGNGNTASGQNSLELNTTGSSDTAAGFYALYPNTTGSNLTGIGRDAGRYITGGLSPNQTSNNSTYLGYQTMAKASGDTDELVLGYQTTGYGSHTAALGSQTTTGTYLQGTVHSVATTPVASSGTITGTNAGGYVSGLSGDTSVTITFANSGWSAWVSCLAGASVSLSTSPYASAISLTAVTFTFPALTGNLFYHCDGN